MTIKRAGLYERVSTDEQAKYGYSIETQIDNLTEYCQKNNIKIVDHYTDEGISGAKPPLKRPSLHRLLEDVKAGKIDIILFTKLDRWFRSVPEYFKVQEILEKYKVEWKAIHEDYDTTTANGRMAITIFLAIAQNEREKTSERIKVVFEKKRKNKEACFGGANNPFGYMKQEDEDGKMRLVKNPEEQEACQTFWNILVTENNLNKAIRTMDELYGIKKDWKSWKRMTQRDFYCGIHRDIDDFCEPYVTPEDFLKLLESKTIKATPTGEVYIFKGLIRCPECGNKFCGDSDKRKKGGRYKFYRCRMRYRGCNNGASLSERKIEKQLLSRLDEFLNSEIARVELEESKPKPKPKTDLKKLKEKRRRLTVAYMAEAIPDDQYLKEDAELKALIAKAELEEPPKPKNIKPLKDMLETDLTSIYETFTDEEKQRFWLGLIKEIKLEDKTITDVLFF